MEFTLFKGAVWQLIKHMDWFAIIILIGLFCLSVFCIAIIAFKFVALRQQRRTLSILMQRIANSKTIADLAAASKEIQNNVGSALLAQILNELRQLLDHKQSTSGEPNKTLRKEDFELLEVATLQTIDGLLIEEEAYLPILGTSSSVAPLVGLFGTIWGLIHAFIDISQEKSADIATVAPGMAEALIITLAGLIVAIPAMISFHYFSNELRKIEADLTSISNKFLALTKQTFVK